MQGRYETNGSERRLIVQTEEYKIYSIDHANGRTEFLVDKAGSDVIGNFDTLEDATRAASGERVA